MSERAARDVIRTAVEAFRAAREAFGVLYSDEVGPFADSLADALQEAGVLAQPGELAAVYRQRDEARDELARLKHQPLHEHPTPWRLGAKLNDTALGQVSLYDGTLEGDGGRPGRWIGVMFTRALGERVVEAVNRASRRAPVGPLLTAEELDEIKRALEPRSGRSEPEWDYDEGARWLQQLLAHADALQAVVDTQNAYMADRDAAVERLNATIHDLASALALYTLPGHVCVPEERLRELEATVSRNPGTVTEVREQG